MESSIAGHDAPAVLDVATLASVVTLHAAVDAVERAFRAIAHGRVVQPSPMGFDLANGEIHVKAAQLTPNEPVVVKVASGFTGNLTHGLPAGDGRCVVLDPTTGQLCAVLLDRGWLTDVRTAAVTALAVRCLASHPLRKLALLGTGMQADLSLQVLSAVCHLPPDGAVIRASGAGLPVLPDGAAEIRAADHLAAGQAPRQPHRGTHRAGARNRGGRGTARRTRPAPSALTNDPPP